MVGYDREETRKLLKLSDAELRSFLRAGLVVPSRTKGAPWFSFQDLVVLRTAKELRGAGVSMARIRKALRALRELLPKGAALSKVHITAQGDEVVVRDEGALFAPSSGQLLFDFGVGELRAEVEPLARKAMAAASRNAALDAEGWFNLGLSLDEGSPVQAMEAYARAVALDSSHVEAHLNLGRLLHEADQLAPAAAHYQHALKTAPDHALAAFNLAVVLEDQGQVAAATRAYERALTLDPAQADAHHNLAHLFERLGQPAAALRHLAAYRRLTKTGR
jgi:tetratricopeptide (TPR) repeat protein